MTATYKRPRPQDVPEEQREPKRPRIQPPVTLSAPHEVIVAALQPQHDVLVASVISSTQIRKRVSSATAHLGATTTSAKARVVLLHARPAQVCKLITVVEHCKRLVRPCYQYNQLFDLPVETSQTGSNDNDDDDDDEDKDGFEVMDTSRLEKAVVLSPPRRPVKSMRVFLAAQPIPELEARPGVTLQAGHVAVSPGKQEESAG
ncbi:alba domain-containing protein [Ophiocordyceps camponoti-floridani]|uniref:Alba domain-containing protein n=1 Tax=Ophiocordyceps camponoti-floridani TaxID=2030778 RepID=A0A8H4VF83_9HYPO|nr:alba domain-containing protein [Ophiocordyceps camponoti-floridani]